MNDSQPTLTDLAAAMYAALPEGEMAHYVNNIAMFHITGDEHYTPVKPANAPYYGPAFTQALTALKDGHTHRIAYHLDRLAAQVKRTGKDGILQELKQIRPVVGTVPQPTDRKRFESGRQPWTGKE